MSGVRRQTRETSVHIRLERQGGETSVQTGDAFLDHMVRTLGRYSGLALTVEATGDLRHHLVEDVAITLGKAVAKECPEACARFGWALVPMDDALVQAAVDLGGRPYYMGGLPSRLYDHFLQSFAVSMEATLHVHVLRGTDRHHTVEAAVKAVGLALRQALREERAVFSTKGTVSLEWEE